MTSGQLDALGPCFLVKGSHLRRENGVAYVGESERTGSGWHRGWDGAGRLPPRSPLGSWVPRLGSDVL